LKTARGIPLFQIHIGQPISGFAGNPFEKWQEAAGPLSIEFYSNQGNVSKNRMKGIANEKIKVVHTLAVIRSFGKFESFTVERWRTYKFNPTPLKCLKIYQASLTKPCNTAYSCVTKIDLLCIKYTFAYRKRLTCLYPA
jgi:hypothetical protein